MRPFRRPTAIRPGLCQIFGIGLLLTAGGPGVTAESPPATPPPAAPAAGATERETAPALAFAAEHHPELVPLLEGIRRDAPAEFSAAIADLDKTRDRLATLGDRQPERQATALADWKLTSRIRLAAARLATNPSPEAEAELRELVGSRARNRAAAGRVERERLSARLQKLNEQLDAFDRDPEAAIARDLEAVRAKAAGAKRGKTQ